ncbi:hypothetical protein PpBr36_03832 [Pyricularia pennisetigena]|uniref:hypothetical protein n=1 Tax=Pyricularia pennisetigena TaxID=1578925 RepID=UPI001154B425|nr:hypothetical protein PpBr36_03832 [Pyricularia pennisetigena]TLS31168.1 hypothetical protein PpBr36_03832 [Pyricularia pennisetigena]
MRLSASVSSASLVLSLIGGSVASPYTVFRADSRTPGQIKRSGGFMSLGATYGLGEDYSITPIRHVGMDESDYNYRRDPWISTTADREYAISHAKRRALGATWHIYHISTSGLRLIDMKEEHQKAGESYRRAHEQEYLVPHRISWAHIDGWDVIDGSGKITYVANNDR